MARRKRGKSKNAKKTNKIHTRKQNTRNQKRRRLKYQQLKKKAKTISQRVKKYRQRLRQRYCTEISTENYLGEMCVRCRHCNAKHFSGEILARRANLSFNDCCSHGGVAECSFNNFPTILKSLFTRTHEYSNEFLNNIRVYNTSFSFASFNANLMNFRGRRAGPYCFKIKGHIYYQINTALYPEPNTNASYGQLFILDPSAANQIRLETFSGLSEPLLKILDKIIRKKNRYAKAYQMMKDEISRLQHKSTKIPEVIMSFIPKSGLDARRYNPQRSNEVAAIFTTTADGDIPDTYVTIRNISTNELEYVSWMDQRVEPWIYPFFYPDGTDGWHDKMQRLDSTRRITRSAYLKNLIAIRDGFNPFLHGGRLFQQWIVDNYVKIEKDRITYCRTHQKELRSESYQGVIDYIANRAEETNAKIGRMIILPSTFIGSPRNMAQNYQDAMAIVRKFGKPDLFITMTCNPNWKEIRENLEPGQQPQDRPDIVARVFNLKKDVLLNTIIENKIFGKVEAWVYVIEFQKRGLPHIHLLVTLCRNYKVTCPEIVDDMICAEIPDPENEPILHDIVMHNMIHGPCGDWCLKDKKCSKHFPKPFQSTTAMDEDGYPCYQRRDTGKYYNRPHGYVVDNRFVVPYSPILLRQFNCHCNVELVSSIKSVKYLFKYIYKGHDAATITMHGEAKNIEDEIVHDEINEHIEARYVGPVEACWRILSKKLYEKSHPVVRMPVHLPNQQSITIHSGDEEFTLNHILEQKNMLLDYFELNKRDETARHYLYTEIPYHCVFHKEKINNVYRSRWRKRKAAFKTIGRMYSVNPSQKELFHLRLLLLTVKGAKSYEELRTVNGELASSFTEACLKRGLIADDSEWHRAMHEAEIWMMPLQMRKLFTRILIHCNPLYPETLWNEFKTAMSEDLYRSMDSISAEQEALRQIYNLLEDEGKNRNDFPSMPPFPEIHRNQIIIEVNYDGIMEIGLTQYEQLNCQQKNIIDIILQSVSNSTLQKTFYIDGPGGSGKTFLYITLWHLLTGQKIKVSTMAYTGIAATLLPNGKTVHKTLGLPVPLYADSTSNIKIETKEANILKETSVFIWDEAPMAPRYALEIMDKILQDIMNNELPFGGKIVILGGDFRQLLPVNIRGTRSETVNLSIKFSSLWPLFQVCKLTINMRTLSEEKEFSEFLLQVGSGDLNNEDNLNLPSACTCNDDIDIAKDVYEDIIRRKRFKEASRYAILAARNLDVNELNNKIVNLLDLTTEHIYTSVDSADNCNENDGINQDLVPEYLNSLSPNGLPPYELRLRKFSIIMLIRNLSINEGLVNGTRLLLLEAGTNLLRCELLTGDKAGDIIFLNRITLMCENIYPFSFTRRQFPIKLAFAITINKSQGQTFEKIGIDLRKDVFNHGQLYVALSRVRSWQSLKIYLGSQRHTTTVKNYVYKELFD